MISDAVQGEMSSLLTVRIRPSRHPVQGFHLLSHGLCHRSVDSLQYGLRPDHMQELG